MARQGRPPRPGTRTSAQRKVMEGIYSPHTVAWVETYSGKLGLGVIPQDDPEFLETETESLTMEPGPTVRIMFLRSGRPLLLNLSIMTGEELAAVELFMKLAFAMARPIVKMRDEAAAHAAENGDDSFARNYRQVPNLIVREGAIRKNGAGLFDGLEDLLDGVRGGEHLPGGVRFFKPGLADVEPDEGLAEDDRPEAD